MQCTVMEPWRALSFNTEQLTERMVSGLCGLVTELGYVSPSSTDPKLLTAGATLSGVHWLLKRPDPGRGGYHIGGIGVTPEEARIKALAESVERHAQLIAYCSGRLDGHPMIFSSYSELPQERSVRLDPSCFQFFSESQCNDPAFKFPRFNESAPLKWILLKNLVDDTDSWVPMQLFLIGYNINTHKQEPWLNSAVTTGTAAHTSGQLALYNALLETVQIDSAMGHWHSSQVACRIVFDKRISSLERIIKRCTRPNGPSVTFYFLPNPDWPVFSVACLMENKSGEVLPRVALGLGSDASLESAMYKAYLESYGVVGFSRMLLFKRQYIDQLDGFDLKNMYDLDDNVAYYALGNKYELIKEKFSENSTVFASDLPPDLTGDVQNKVEKIMGIFRKKNLPLFVTDLDTLEAKQLGFVVKRVYSPLTLTLSLPSAPHANHPRFEAYGGFSNDQIHPYP